MRYEVPEIKVIGLNAEDIIKTSATIGGAGGENETPFNPASVTVEGDLDSKY